MRTQARKNLNSAKEKSKLYYDEKINPLEVKIGDNVFLFKGGKIKKLDSYYTGPYEILEVSGKGNVKISYKGKPTVVHINRLKQFRYNRRHFFNNQNKRTGRIQKFNSQFRAIKSHCHCRHVGYNELPT